ncbi:YmdB family metallophosphoesterase, partial [Paraburkholderia sp. SIMBA_030]|uniref:YmdB family metallophosphoesterase n=1 Tax=Paraburkholderia sp. SIMBA_030 TaxID=3085773 RepID=UPI00397BF668
MRLLFLGDMVGKTGRTAVWDRLPGLVSDLKLDFVIVNGENAAGGFGITEDIFLETINAGADVVTTGNHVWDQKDAVAFAGRP